jgi:O-antigen/teichoic acid export membrane protein
MTAASLLRLVAPLRTRLGVDGAVAYTVAGRLCSIIGSTGTVLLVVHFLSSVEQGYYYTLLSLVNLQTVFELGFAFVIQQMAAHECASVAWREDGLLSCEPRTEARLASILRKTARWYSVAATLMGVVLLPLGIGFFSRQEHAGASVDWRSPWLLSVLSCCLLFFLNPFASFLEGCGQIRQVAKMRFAQAAVSIPIAWGALAAGKGLYSPALIILAYIGVASVFFMRRSRLFLALARCPSGDYAFSWRTEVWSFQWRTGVSWLCSYFTTQVFTPVLFAYRGPAEAGRFGMSMNIAGYLGAVVLSWISTKATPFGQMVACGQLKRLEAVFFRTLRQSLAVLAALVALCMGGILALQFIAKPLATRMVAPPIFALLLVTTLSVFIAQSEAIYLRTRKTEPFLFQSLLVAILTTAGVYLFAPRFGAAGAAATYFISSGVVGLAVATIIFQNRRKQERTQASAYIEVGASV